MTPYERGSLAREEQQLGLPPDRLLLNLVPGGLREDEREETEAEFQAGRERCRKTVVQSQREYLADYYDRRAQRSAADGPTAAACLLMLLFCVLLALFASWVNAFWLPVPGVGR